MITIQTLNIGGAGSTIFDAITIQTLRTGDAGSTTLDDHHTNTSHW